MAPVALHLLPSIRAGSSPMFTHAPCPRVCTTTVENVEYDWPDADTVAIAPAGAGVFAAPSGKTPRAWVVRAGPPHPPTAGVERGRAGHRTSAAAPPPERAPRWFARRPVKPR